VSTRTWANTVVTVQQASRVTCSNVACKLCTPALPASVYSSPARSLKVHDVRWLEVPVHQPSSVQVCQGTRNLVQRSHPLPHVRLVGRQPVSQCDCTSLQYDCMGKAVRGGGRTAAAGTATCSETKCVAGIPIKDIQPWIGSQKRVMHSVTTHCWRGLLLVGGQS
jgi:hypothetical protein